MSRGPRGGAHTCPRRAGYDRAPCCGGESSSPQAALALAAFVCVIAPTTLVVAARSTRTRSSRPSTRALTSTTSSGCRTGELPRQGERLTRQHAARRWPARGTVLPALTSAPVRRTRAGDTTSSRRRYQYEAQQPPTYYAVDGRPMRWAAQKVLGIDSRLDATRAGRASSGWWWACCCSGPRAGPMAIEPLPLGSALLADQRRPDPGAHSAGQADTAGLFPTAGRAGGDCPIARAVSAALSNPPRAHARGLRPRRVCWPFHPQGPQLFRSRCLRGLCRAAGRSHPRKPPTSSRLAGLTSPHQPAVERCAQRHQHRQRARR